MLRVLLNSSDLSRQVPVIDIVLSDDASQVVKFAIPLTQTTDSIVSTVDRYHEPREQAIAQNLALAFTTAWSLRRRGERMTPFRIA